MIESNARDCRSAGHGSGPEYQGFPIGLSLKREMLTFNGLSFLFSPVSFSMLGSQKAKEKKTGKIVAKFGMML